ncbi:MAG: hypothetical protein H6739_28380 [Alphaproteobacteria bacterium]|nr:hypothetical protein [Alphaproteobacteria bacterium]
MSENPYAPPAADLDQVRFGELGEAEDIRRLHLQHEASIRSFGLLYIIGGAMALLGGLVIGVGDVARTLGSSGPSAGGNERVVLALLLGFYMVVGAINLYVGVGLRRLNPGVKLAATLLACLSLLSIPIGTLMGGYLLYLLHSQKGKVVMSPTYAEIRAATPHIVYKTSPLAWAIIGLMVLFFVGLIALAVVG